MSYARAHEPAEPTGPTPDPPSPPSDREPSPPRSPRRRGVAMSVLWFGPDAAEDAPAARHDADL